MRVMPNLTSWESHKVVHAGKIIAVKVAPDPLNWLIEDADGNPVLFRPPVDICARGQAQPGDYIVIYADGYVSWSPGAAFEAGYTKVPA
jgi:hypothetical protein